MRIQDRHEPDEHGDELCAGDAGETRGSSGQAPTPGLDAPSIEFWMWHDGVLLPATADELEWIHECEREREARWRLRQWREVDNRESGASPARWLRARLKSSLATLRAHQPRGGAAAVHDKRPFRRGH